MKQGRMLPLVRGRAAKAVVLAVIAVWLFVVPARAQGQVLEVAAWSHPPYAYVGDSGKWQGQAVEAVEKVLVSMGYAPRFVALPFKRCLASMRHGDLSIMLPCAISEERSRYMQFSDPVYRISTVLWKKGSNMENCWQDYDDLAGLRIGVGLGYSYGANWDEAVATGIFVLEFAVGKSPILNHFQMAAEGRIDMFISDLKVGYYLKAKHAPRFDDIYPCPKKIGKDRAFGTPISRKYFENHGLSPDAFIDRFNAILKESGVR
ncbi:transporter substrate-binding domain-containing protein [Pseudodesulfovibrio sp. S3-i]|nr:transporter substrate-binding domain-containing protein [Pseudodesulfovibrio sp. S3-i]